MLAKCPYCKGSCIRERWRVSSFWKCATCGLFFQNPKPTDRELQSIYAKSWTEPEKYSSETGGTDLRLARIYARRLAKDLGRKGFHNSRILDYGAGRGAMAETLNELGAEVSCLEPFGHEFLRSRGFEVYRSLQEISARERFDGAVMIDVWEHLSEPWKVLRKLCTLLGPGGWVLVAAPNPLGLNARMSGGHWREAKKRVHLLFPGPGTMQQVLIHSGFATYRRLKWVVRTTDNPARHLLHLGLQICGFEGELRYLAWKK